MQNAAARGLIPRLLTLLRPRQPTKAVYVDAPLPPGCTDADLQRICHRIDRLSSAYRQRFRPEGLMDVPQGVRLHEGCLQLARRDHAGVLPLQDALGDPGALSLIARGLLVQLTQLEALNFVHGGLAPDALTVHRDHALPSASLGSFLHGRFTDEPLTPENLYESPWASPEVWRCLHQPCNAPLLPFNDVFSAACLLHTLATGRPPVAAPYGCTPAEAVCTLRPIHLEGLQGPLAELLRWMLSSAAAERPTAQQVLDAFVAVDDAGLMAAPPAAGSVREAAGLRLLHTPPTPQHLPTQLHGLTAAGQSLLVREHASLWDPCGMQGAFAQRQRQRRQRELARLQQVCRESRLWQDAQPLVDENRFFATDPPLTAAPLPTDAALTLGQLHRLNNSPFLLDARMTELLYAVQTLHDSGYLLGCFSEAAFCVHLRGEQATVHLSDVSGALPCASLPPPSDLSPEASELRVLSPELTQYLASGTAGGGCDRLFWVDTSSDLFTLGLLYHRILTGEYPELAEPDHGAYAPALLHDGEAASAFRLSPALDSPHRRLILQMLSLDPLERPVSCAHAADCIMGFYTA